MRTVIMAGGYGTRIANMNKETPKPMLCMMGMPILEHQLRVLKRQGCEDVTLVIGYLGKQIKEYFGDGSQQSPVTGEPLGVRIHYIEEKEPLGTAGALFYLKNEMKEDFLLLNGDIIFDIDIARFQDFHLKQGGKATILTHPNDHPYDSGIVVTDKECRVVGWLHKEEKRCWYKNRVNAGLHMLSPKLLKLPLFDKVQKLDLDRDVLKPLIGEGSLISYDSPEYVKDMGTPNRFYEVMEDLRLGKAEDKNLSRKQKAIFLDRDGTLNRYVGFLTSINQFELLEGAGEAVRRINRSGYLAVVVTNQPVIARGEISEEELEEIHNKMETLLGKEGAYLDAIYYCPHHPHIGYEGERKELKTDCFCRKPNPGMLLRAAEEFHIDLTQSWIIGDSEKDIQAGKAAGCQTSYIKGSGENGEGFASLLDAVQAILN